MSPFLKIDWKAPFGREIIKYAKLQHRFTKTQKYNKNLADEYTSVPTEALRLPNHYADQIINMVPASVKALEVPQAYLIRMTETDALQPVLPAHVDYNRTCGINFYLEADGEKTHYYEWDSELKSLTETETFVAAQGDCWLIDTSIPHSVTLKPNQQRLILTLSFSHTSFPEVAARLRRVCNV